MSGGRVKSTFQAARSDAAPDDTQAELRRAVPSPTRGESHGLAEGCPSRRGLDERVPTREVWARMVLTGEVWARRVLTGVVMTSEVWTR